MDKLNSSHSSKWGFAENREKNEPTKSWVPSFKSTFTALTTGIFLAALALTPFSYLNAGSAVAASTNYIHSKYQNYKQMCQTAGTVDTTNAPHMNYWKSESSDKTEMLPTQHCADTHEWRKKLISSAEHNIVISGNYCGGLAFDELLDLIEQRMKEKPNLKVIIIGYPGFIKEENVNVPQSDGTRIEQAVHNKTKLEALQKQFANRFSLVESPHTWMTSPSVKKSTNHTKYFGIDWGAYYILGGSAIKDNFNQTGIDNPLEAVLGKELNNELFETLSELEAFASICNQAASGDEEVEMIDFNQYAHLAKRLDTLVQKIEVQTKRLYSYQNIELNNKLQILYFVNSGLRQFSSILMSLDKRDKEVFISNVKFAEELVAALSSHTLEDHSEEGGSYLEALTNFAKQASLFREAVETNFFSDTSSIVDSGLAGLMVPGSFRDMDFVFHNTEGERSPGRQLFLQMLTLAYRWEQFNAAVKKDESIPAYKPEEVPYFASFIPSTEKITPLPIQETDTPTIRLMKEPMKDPKEVKTSVPAFDRHPAVEKEGSMKVLFSGPEQPNQTSDFRKELLFQIENAKEEIVINHMYFHPTQDVQDALVKAAERGVRIKIITCGVHPKSPNTQRVFGPRNTYNFANLVNRLSEDKKSNVEVYEYTQNKKGLHKKVIVFDKEHVLAGSSNFGYKSLETSSDHEVNFLASSKTFAKETLDVCDKDIAHSERVENPGKISYMQQGRAAAHRLAAPLIG